MVSGALTRRLRRFSQDRNGNTAMMFCLAAVPFFGILGFATDYGMALADKAKLDGAADAAALAAIRVAQSAIQGGASRTAAMTAGSAQALTTFRANAGSLAYGSAPTPAFTWNAGASGQTLTLTASYSMTMTNAFSKIIGYSTTTVKGTAAATLTMPTYINYYIITDVSQSMGVAATQADMQNLYDRVIKYKNYDNQNSANNNIGCVFGCHVQGGGSGYTQPDSNENLAHLAKYGSPIKLRIDSARDAIIAVLQDAANANTQSGMNLVQVGIYTMQRDPFSSGTYIKNVVSPPNSNFSGTTAAVNDVTKFDLGNNDGSVGIGDTDFANSLNAFNSNVLQTQGDGSTQSKALNFVFIITDGIFDTPGSCTYGHCTGAFNDSSCTQLKAKATVGVIYTTYNPVYYKNVQANGLVDTYQYLVAPTINSVPGNLQACSSDKNSYYFEAQDGPAITTAMQKLFAPTVRAAMLSK